MKTILYTMLAIAALALTATAAVPCKCTDCGGKCCPCECQAGCC